MGTTKNTRYPFDPTIPNPEPVVVTPNMAREWLGERANAPWKDSKAVILQYSRAMQEHRWPMNGDPIIFDWNGKLISGEKRLLACIHSGEDFASLIVRGVHPDAAMTLRSHLQRTHKDMFSINGEVYASELASAWPIVMGYLHGHGKRTYNVARRDKLGFQEMEGITQRYPEMRESAQFVRDIGAVGKMGPGLTTAIHYLMSLDDRGKANAFMNILVDPTLDPQSAAAAMADKLESEKRTGQGYRLGLFIKAWNRFREGRNLSSSALRYQDRNDGDIKREPLPRMDGIPEGMQIDIVDLPNARHAQEDADSVVISSGNVRTSFVLIDREIATDLLSRNGPVGGHGNRKLRKTHVSSLGRDMLNDAWIFNGQPIKVAASGRLIDGQHRLEACKATGVAFWTLLVENLDDEVFTTFDTGQRLGLAGTLRDKGYTESVTLAAAIALLSKVFHKGWRTPTSGEGLDFIAEHPLLPASVESTRKNPAQTFSPRSFIAAIDYLAGSVDRDVADSFLARLGDGANLDTATPLLVLRNNLIAQKKSNSRPVTERILRYSMVAWNGHRKGIVPFVLRDPHKFPELV